MKFIQIIIAIVFALGLSINLSAQNPQDAPNNDVQVQSHIAKYNLLKKVKQNIERKQGNNPDEDNENETERKPVKPIIEPTKSNKALKSKTHKKKN